MIFCINTLFYFYNIQINQYANSIVSIQYNDLIFYVFNFLHFYSKYLYISVIYDEILFNSLPQIGTK
jgi:hypothetical protein